MDDEMPYSINDMLIWIVNYVHQDMVLLRLFITETERYMCCYSDDGFYEEEEDAEDYDEDYDDDDDEEDYEEDEEEEVEEEELQPIDRIKHYFVRSIVLNQHFIHTSLILKSLDKVEQPLIDNLLAGFDELKKCWRTDDAELLESACKKLWVAWENFATKFYKAYGYTVISPN